MTHKNDHHLSAAVRARFTDELNQAIARAYDRGWKDACDNVLTEAYRLISLMKPNTLRPGTITHSIVDIIRMHAGLSSTGLREQVTQAHPTAKPATIRQITHYLRKKGLIVKHSGRWFQS